MCWFWGKEHSLQSLQKDISCPLENNLFKWILNCNFWMTFMKKNTQGNLWPMISRVTDSLTTDLICALLTLNWPLKGAPFTFTCIVSHHNACTIWSRLNFLQTRTDKQTDTDTCCTALARLNIEPHKERVQMTIKIKVLIPWLPILLMYLFFEDGSYSK